MHQKNSQSRHKNSAALSKTSDRKKSSNRRSLWDIASKYASQIPEEAWDKVPADLSRNIDHYLYGMPKKNK